MPTIKLTNVTKKWGKFYAVDHLNLTIEDNAFITLLGPSGCGKTTTLRMIAGLEVPTEGRIEIGDRVVFDSEKGINIPANKRKVGFLFQNYALWPNMTVYQNIAFGLSNIKEEMPKIDMEAKTTGDLIRCLLDGENLIDLLYACMDVKGKMEEEKLYQSLMDTYGISIYTAKKLAAYHLQDEIHPKDDMAKRCKELQERLDAKRQEYVRSGRSLNENYEIVKNGVVETEIRKLSKEEVDLTVRRVARVVKLGELMHRYPAELSGGQQQRVAIARTLAPEPEVLFMDEPLSNLDAKLRLEMRYELQRLHVETGSTFVYVTHDQMEAMTLATKICLIHNGILQQYDAPLTVYNRPKNLFVADFVGNPSINLLHATGEILQNGSVQLSLLGNKKAVFTPNEDGEQKLLGTDDYVVGIRPECLAIDCEQGISAEIYGVMPTGMESTIKVKVGELLLTGVVFGGVVYTIGTRTKVGVRGSDILLYKKDTGDFICAGTLSLQEVHESI